MKRVFFALMITVIVFLTVPVQKMRAASCSNSTLYDVGTYGFMEEAYYGGLGTGEGYITFLSSGSFLHSGYGGTNGTISHYSLSGTYTVNSNCTLTLTYSNGTEVQGVVVSSGNEVFLNQLTTGVTMIMDLKAVTVTACSAGTLYNNVTYGYYGKVLYPSFGTTVGYITFTSSGAFAGVIVGGSGGNVSTFDISGTYTVNSNCTVTLTYSNNTVNQGMIVSSGGEVFLVQTSPSGTNTLVDLKKE